MRFCSAVSSDLLNLALVTSDLRILKLRRSRLEEDSKQHVVLPFQLEQEGLREPMPVLLLEREFSPQLRSICRKMQGTGALRFFAASQWGNSHIVEYEAQSATFRSFNLVPAPQCSWTQLGIEILCCH